MGEKKVSSMSMKVTKIGDVFFNTKSSSTVNALFHYNTQKEYITEVLTADMSITKLKLKNLRLSTKCN